MRPPLFLRLITNVSLAALLLPGCCSAPSSATSTARAGTTAQAADTERSKLPTPLDLALTPLAIAYYLYNPFLDTQRPTEPERFEQSAHQVARESRP